MTVGQVGQLPAQEIQAWAVFEQRFGPITLHERIDNMAAQVSYYVAQVASEKPLAFGDFVPRWGRAPVPEGDGVIDFVEAVARRYAKKEG